MEQSVGEWLSRDSLGKFEHVTMLLGNVHPFRIGQPQSGVRVERERIDKPRHAISVVKHRASVIGMARHATMECAVVENE